MPSFRRADFESMAKSVGPILHTYHRAHHVHIAMIFRRGRNCIASSINKVGSRSRGAGYSACTIHAERAALKQLGDLEKLRGATMVVLRITRNGEMRGSKPCSECQCHLQKCIREYGLLRVFYS